MPASSRACSRSSSSSIPPAWARVLYRKYRFATCAARVGHAWPRHGAQDCRHHLELAESQQLQDLQRLTGCSGSELEAALALVRSGNRRPGARPVVARRIPRAGRLRPAQAGRLGSRTEPGGYPARTPQRAVRRHGHGLAGPGHVGAQLQEAQWLVRSLEIRNDTVLRVARTIVERQQAFLDRSEESMRPMTLPDVARRWTCTSRPSRA